jgi:hypothetical protein
MASEEKVIKTRKTHLLTNKNGELSKPWVKFFSRLESFPSIELTNWTEYEFLGYLIKRYKDYSGQDYTISMSSAPSQNYDLINIKKIISILHASVYYNKSFNRQYVKDYIDWMFDVDIIPKKKKITSVAFFTTLSNINKFKIQYENSKKITRSSIIPQTYKELAESLNIDISTYGDLAFIKLAIESGEDGGLELYQVYFNKLLEMGLEKSVLETLE